LRVCFPVTIGGGISTSNSPSISAQVASSAMQTQQVLSSFDADSSVGSTMVSQNTAIDGATDTQATANDGSSTNITVSNSNSNVASNTGSGSDNSIDDSMSGSDTSGQSDADVIAEQIVAQNMQEQKEELEQQQQETGEYADESQLIAYMGFVQGFDGYLQTSIPEQDTWYEPKDIYANVLLPDNNNAFVSLYGKSLNDMNGMINMQPNL